MKKIIYLLLLFSCWACQKPTEIDKKLQQEQDVFYQELIKKQENEIFQLYNMVINRGSQKDEELLAEKTIDLQRLFLKLNTHLNEEDSLQFYLKNYNKKLKEITLILENAKMKDVFPSVKKEENQSIITYLEIIKSYSFISMNYKINKIK